MPTECIRDFMILKNDVYFWKIDFNDNNMIWSETSNFINIFLTFDIQNMILKDLEIIWNRKFYDNI